MRMILVHEFVSGGGLAGCQMPASLAREGQAMLEALLADLHAIGCHEIVATRDLRVPLSVPPGVELVVLSECCSGEGASVAGSSTVLLSGPHQDMMAIGRDFA